MSSNASSNALTPLDQELLEELKTQLSRKLSSLYGGKLELAHGVLLYENQLATTRGIYNQQHRKDGQKNKSKTIRGHNFEILTAGQKNRQAVLDKTGNKTYTTDQLYEMKKKGELPDSIPASLAIHNHKQVDEVEVDVQGRVIRTYQLKNRQTAELAAQDFLEERYVCATYEEYSRIKEAKISQCKKLISSNDPKIAEKAKKDLCEREKMKISKEQWTPPNELTVPYEQRKDVIKNLKKMAKSKDPIKAELANKALTKIEKTKNEGGVTRKESKSPHTTIVIETAKDFGGRTAKRASTLILAELSLFSVGGVIWEVKDEIAHPGLTPIKDRLERLVLSVWNRLNNSSNMIRKKEFALEIVTVVSGALANIFKSAKDFIKLLWEKVKEVWDAIFNYITGKITSFRDLILVIFKTFATIGLASLALALETELTALGLPSILAGILSASVLAVAIVLTCRGLEGLVLGWVSLFSKAEVAKLRAKQVEAKCKEVLPKMIEERKALEALTKQVHDEREAILAKSFHVLNSPQGQADVNLALSALEKINIQFGASLGFQNFDKFDQMMLSNEPLKI
jgi:hypothetical protein